MTKATLKRANELADLIGQLESLIIKESRQPVIGSASGCLAIKEIGEIFTENRKRLTDKLNQKLSQYKEEFFKLK